MATSTLGNGTLVLAGTTSGTTTVTATAVAGTTTLTLPAATDTLVGKATTDTLTNKTLTGAVMNGTLGATTPSTVAATTLTTSSTVTHNGGTANGVGYLDGSKVLTTGSALVFDGTNLGVGTSSPTTKLDVLGSGDGEVRIRAGSDAALIFSETTANKNWKLKPSAGDFFWQYSATAYNSGYSALMALTSSGNLGIGTSSPSVKLDVSQSQNGQTAVQLTNSNAGASAEATFIANNGTYIGSFGVAGASKSAFGAILASDAYIFSNANVANTGITLMANSANGVIKFATGGSAEKMRIESSGNLLVGTTSSAGNYKVQSVNTSSSGNAMWLQNSSGNDRGILTMRHDMATGGTTGNMVTFQNASGSGVGAITSSNTATTYATSSDYRLKHDIQPMTGALAKVALLKPCTYKWNADDSQSQGFIAHDLQEVVPECVTGEKDAVDADGNPKYQGIDTSFLVATLTAAIQEQQALITQLTARITALESA